MVVPGPVHWPVEGLKIWAATTQCLCLGLSVRAVVTGCYSSGVSALIAAAKPRRVLNGLGGDVSSKDNESVEG